MCVHVRQWGCERRSVEIRLPIILLDHTFFTSFYA